MTIQEFIHQTPLERTLLMGYYGGGNYGDELLLEVMMNLLSAKGVKKADVAYMPYCNFTTYHRDFGYRPFRANSVFGLLKAIMRNKQVIVGGGGIWGLDAKLQPLLMSIALFLSRWLFGKKVYLVGVGYYRSTNWYGHVGAWLAAKASNIIIGRDDETAANFSRFSSRVHRDVDIAWYLQEVETRAYSEELQKLEETVPTTGRTLFITLRRFSARHQNDYRDIIDATIAEHPDTNIVVALLEPRSIDPDSYNQLLAWQKKYPHVRAIDFAYNPVALYLFLQKHRKELAVISPQFHAVLTAHLQGVPFLPVVYDNKVQELFGQIGIKDTLSIYDLTAGDVRQFIDRFYEARA